MSFYALLDAGQCASNIFNNQSAAQSVDSQNNISLDLNSSPVILALWYLIIILVDRLKERTERTKTIWISNLSKGQKTIWGPVKKNKGNNKETRHRTTP
jgi:hypothetical protein